MIQAIGLTSNARKGRPSVDDVSFEAHPGRVTALLGAPGAGKTTSLRLMLELQQGRGITYFRSRPLHRIPHPAREVGVLLGEVPGHPSRTVRGQLRMLCAATGVPVRRADEVLEATGLVNLRGERLVTLSRGMDRRLGLACAVLADPHTLVLDAPTEGLSAPEGRWMHGALRAHADQGGTVLFTTADPREAADAADRVVTLDGGRLVADQDAGDFARTRLRPRVAVRSPHAARLGQLIAKEARARRHSLEVVGEGGNRLSVYGATCADVGDTAFRHGILVHQLADETGDMGPGVGRPDAQAPDGTVEEQDRTVEAPDQAVKAQEQAVDGQGRRGGAQGETARVQDGTARAQGETARAQAEVAHHDQGRATYAGTDTGTGAGGTGDARDAGAQTGQANPVRPVSSPDGVSPADSTAVAGELPSLPPPLTVRPAPGPLRPVRYELRRATGVGTGYVTAAAVLLASVFISLSLARQGHTPLPYLLAAWPGQLPLPPAALGAGLLGALAFGEEFRRPALAADRGTVPRRLGLLTAKLLVAAATALLFAFLSLGCDAALLRLFYGPELVRLPDDWGVLTASWLGLTTGCAWAGVLAAGVFRSTAAGLASVLAVPVVVVPLVQKALTGPSVRTAAGLPARLRDLALVQWPFGAERYLSAGVRMVAQPVGGALMLSLTALLCAYLVTGLRSRAR